jgi:hypothetical protein
VTADGQTLVPGQRVLWRRAPDQTWIVQKVPEDRAERLGYVWLQAEDDEMLGVVTSIGELEALPERSLEHLVDAAREAVKLLESLRLLEALELLEDALEHVDRLEKPTLVHLSRVPAVPAVAVCGADIQNQHTADTADPNKVSCVPCLRTAVWTATAEKEIATSAKVRAEARDLRPRLRQAAEIDVALDKGWREGVEDAIETIEAPVSSLVEARVALAKLLDQECPRPSDRTKDSVTPGKDNG